jgi:hypothetical protein
MEMAGGSRGHLAALPATSELAVAVVSAASVDTACHRTGGGVEPIDGALWFVQKGQQSRNFSQIKTGCEAGGGQHT